MPPRTPRRNNSCTGTFSTEEHNGSYQKGCKAMARLIKWTAPLAAIALLLTLATVQTRAEDKKDTGKITGTVLDKDGKPAAGAEVLVLHPAAKSKNADKEKAEKPAKGDKPISVVPAQKTDDKGEFTF